MYTLEVTMKGDCNDSQEDPFEQKNPETRFSQDSHASHLSNAPRESLAARERKA